jgi:UDP-N-acetylmuramyl pentapeptide phosphotransferase/UDP-N-acetylglucosamine-1-phosphate transferase
MPITIYCFSLLLGALGAFSIARMGFYFGLKDKPSERSSHSKTTPKGGGIGILVSFIVASFFFEADPFLVVSGSFISLISLLGDKFDLSPMVRLPAHFLAALLLLFFLLPQPSINAFLLMPIAIFIVFYIVGTANFYNFMDGINGIAAITGIIGFGFLAFAASSIGNELIRDLSICIALACIGFLPFNLPRAQVFMGDVGSILLGFLFSVFVLLLARNVLEFICFVAFLFPFYADELTTMAIRLRNGENLLKPHRRHFYQVMTNQAGLPHWQVAIGYGIFQLLVASSILLVQPYGYFPVLISLFVYFIIFSALRIYLQSRFEFSNTL